MGKYVANQVRSESLAELYYCTNGSYFLSERITSDGDYANVWIYRGSGDIHKIELKPGYDWVGVGEIVLEINYDGYFNWVLYTQDVIDFIEYFSEVMD